MTTKDSRQNKCKQHVNYKQNYIDVYKFEFEDTRDKTQGDNNK